MISNGNISYTYDEVGNLLSSTGTKTLGNGKLLKDENPIRYASYYFDKETNLYYLKARYYNSELGRFNTRDPVVNENLYVYAENNPVIFKDDNGEFIGAVIGAVIGAAFLAWAIYDAYKAIKSGSKSDIAMAAAGFIPAAKNC